jgi:5-formyltetrahydrofolate cyclo-ligase
MPVKTKLRARMLAVRKAIPSEVRDERAAGIVSRLFELPEASATGAWLLYWAFGSEVPTRRLIERALAEGRTVALPVLRNERLEPAVLSGLEVTAPSGYGPHEPLDGRPLLPGEVALVVVPGVAFDRRGHRLGRGGGHYDRFLRDLGAGPPRVALAFHEQLVDDIPHQPGDEDVDVVVTDREIVVCRDGPSHGSAPEPGGQPPPNPRPGR